MFGRHIVSGKVVAKNGYGAAPSPGEIAPTKQNAVFLRAADAGLSRPSEDPGEWILRVEGLDQHGNPYAQNKYVDEMTFNCTEIGDAWPLTSTT
jgi:hypothetical protein